MVAAGHGQRPCILSPDVGWTYDDLLAQVNRIANVLVGRFGLAPGNRVLLRAPNNPMMVATYLAVIKAGGIVVATMPLLRAANSRRSSRRRRSRLRCATRACGGTGQGGRAPRR